MFGDNYYQLYYFHNGSIHVNSVVSDFLLIVGYYCTLCNVSIHRIEKYVGENG